MSNDAAVLVRWMRSRRLIGVLALQLLLAAVVMGWGQTLVEMPTGTGSVLVGMWVLVPMVAGSAIAIGLATDLGEWDEVSARPVWRWDLLYAVTLTIVTGCLFVVASLLSGAASTAPAGVRNVAFFAGLGLLAGRWFQRRLSWVLPLGVLLPMVYFGYDETNVPHWWSIPLQHMDGLTAALASAVFLIGLTAATISPWSVRRIWDVVGRRR